MLQTENAEPVTEFEFRSTYDNVIDELRRKQQVLLAVIDAKIRSLPKNRETGERSFAVFDLMREIANESTSDPLNVLFDKAERDVGDDNAENCVRHEFGVLVYGRLLEAAETWTVRNNYKSNAACYEPFDRTYTQMQTSES